MKYQRYLDYKGYRIGAAALPVDKLWRSILAVEQPTKGSEAMGMVDLCACSYQAIDQGIVTARKLIDCDDFSLLLPSKELTVDTKIRTSAADDQPRSDAPTLDAARAL